MSRKGNLSAFTVKTIEEINMGSSLFNRGSVNVSEVNEPEVTESAFAESSFLAGAEDVLASPVAVEREVTDNVVNVSVTEEVLTEAGIGGDVKKLAEDLNNSDLANHFRDLQYTIQMAGDRALVHTASTLAENVRLKEEIEELKAEMERLKENAEFIESEKLALQETNQDLVRENEELKASLAAVHNLSNVSVLSQGEVTPLKGKYGRGD